MVQREYEIATPLSQKTLIPVLYLITSAPIDSRIFEEKKFFDGGFVLFLLCFLEAVLFWKQKSLITKGSIWKLSFASKEKIQIITPLHLAALFGCLDFCNQVNWRNYGPYHGKEC